MGTLPPSGGDATPAESRVSVGVSAEKESVARWSVFSALFLTVSKGVVGFLTGSLGILSEALHSSLDLLAAVITWLAVRVSGKPADETHHYGHTKIESLSALAEIVLLVLTCFWIVLEAYERLFGKHDGQLMVTWSSFAVMLLSIIVGVLNSRNLYRAAEKHRSQALAADALHFSSDVISSVVVIIGLVFAAYGYPKADPLAALGVAVLIAFACYNMGKEALDVLMDRAPDGMADEIRRLALSVPGVLQITTLRVRSAGGNDGFADLTLLVARDLPFEQAHGISHQVELVVRQKFPGLAIHAHVEPGTVDSSGDDLLLKIRRLALCHGGVINLHNLALRDIGDSWQVVLHLEVDEQMSLAGAHQVASEMEQQIRGLDRRVGRVVTHLEPASSASCESRDVTESFAALVTRVAELTVGVPGLSDPHGIKVHSAGTRLNLDMHARADGALTVAQSHKISIVLEEKIREAFPQLATIVVHLEPVKTAGA